MKKLIYFASVFLLIVSDLSACSSTQHAAPSNHHYTTISSKKQVSQSVSNKIEKQLVARKDVTKARVIKKDNQLLVAFKIPHFDRFHILDVEKKVKADLKKQYPGYQIDVSTDHKIYLEIDRLERKIHSNKVNPDKLRKAFSNLKTLMKKQT